MFKTKKDLDIHVRSLLSRLKTDTDINLRGFTIAKFYYKIHEYATAEHYLTGYLSVKDDNPAAHKLLGQIYLELKKNEKAIAMFQRSLQLDPKQHDLLTQVCQLLLSDKTISANRAKYWCDLAESERLQNDAVLNLRLKLIDNSSSEPNQVGERILKEITLRPEDAGLRVRYVRYLIEQNNVAEAFKYVYNVEMDNKDLFASSGEWYNSILLVLKKYELLSNSKKDWQFWVLMIICIEKQVAISLTENSSLPSGGTTETANLLFTFDQHLFQASQCVKKLAPEPELATVFIEHFFGQLCLHAASLIFKRELLQNKNNWKETVKQSVPLLMLAFQVGAVDLNQPWIRNCDEKSKRLVQLWRNEAAFRCAQAGRTILACIDENNENDPGNNISARTWQSADDMIIQVRQCFSSIAWRQNTFGLLFCNSDQKIKEQSSYLVCNSKVTEQSCDLPSYAFIETYEEIAQNLKPDSLAHSVYLSIGNPNLSSVRCKFFSGLNFSTNNLSFCGAESLNQLDIETFLYASAIQATRQLESEKNMYENLNSNLVQKPFLLPFANIHLKLCSEEQRNWWSAAYNVYKNKTGDNLSETRSILQHGIEAVRCVNSPKIDLIIVLKLGQIFAARAEDTVKAIEKSLLEARADMLYKYALTMFKMHKKNVLEPFRKLFKYNCIDATIAEREICELTDKAASYLATRLMNKAQYDDVIDQLTGIQLPYATYFQSEAYRKLDESNKTPIKDKNMYLDRAREFLNQSLNLLQNENHTHPLYTTIQSDIKRLQFGSKLMSDKLNNSNSSNYEDAEAGDFLNNTPIYHSRNVSIRETPRQAARNAELESLCKQMANTLNLLKDEVIDFIKPELTGLRKEIAGLKDKVSTLEESLKKKSNAPSTDDPSNVYDDLYMIDDELQNQLYPSTPQSVMYGNYPPQQNAQKMLPPNLGVGAALPSQLGQQLNNPMFNNPMFNQPFAMNPYYPGQYMVPPQPPTSAPQMSLGHGPPMNQQQRNMLGMKVDQNPLPMMPPFMPPVDNRNSGMLQLLQSNPQMPQLQPDLSANSFMPMPPVGGGLGGLPPVNKPIINQPVEKTPPVNVVITSSDPLPSSNQINSIQSFPTLSVTIPSHHIKQSITEPKTQPSAVVAPVVPQFPRPSAEPFSFKMPERANVTEVEEHDDSHEETEYDPMPDFQPIIALPDEIVVKTGEEDEEVLFCARAKLFRFFEKEWKERGLGELKILKNKDKKTRILMRREQVLKICANHQINGDLFLTRPPNETKGYIWAANDFSEGALSLEKFLVRFKTPELASEFHNVFIKCRDEAKLLENGESKPDATSTPAPLPLFGKPVSKPAPAPLFGKPAEKTAPVQLFGKPAAPQAENTTPLPLFFGKPAAPQTDNAAPLPLFGKLLTNSTPTTTETAPKPFSTFTTDTSSTAKPFEKLFSSLSKSTTLQPPAAEPKAAPVAVQASPSKAGSDNEDEYVPTAEFAPVIALPDLVEVTTGEENENVLYEHRAKLLRFDKTTNEWKERGLGDIKLLQDKTDKNKIRLLMRRETIHKLCCNQRLTKDTVFKHPKNTKNALMWIGQDFSEGELTVETLTVRFKTAEICEQFLNAVTKAQAGLTEGDSQPDAAKEEPKPATQGFGDKFKPKAGSWSCEGCYTNNIGVDYCVACEAPRDSTVPKKEPQSLLPKTTPVSKFSFGFGAAQATASPSTPTSAFGDKFKPKVGSWECKGCYISNGSDKLYCVACNSPKDDTVPAKAAESILKDAPKPGTFSFGFSANKTTSTSAPAPPAATTPAASGFGDKFKPSAGSWTCEGCYVSNAGSVATCPACGTNKDPSAPKPPPKDLLATTSTQKFSFGFPPATPTAPAAAPAAQPAASAINFEADKKFEFKFGAAKATEPAKDLFTFVPKTSLEKPEFSFTLKAKSPNKTKTDGHENVEEEDGDEVAEEEENNTYFTPVIPLPDKIDVRTGEEDEDVLYSHRSKLYRFVDGEWKERGLGDVKILRHKANKKLRVVMRREKILKICLNHALTDAVEYKRKDEKAWHFVANDFSEGEVELMQFCLRFKTKEIAEKFHQAALDALSGSAEPLASEPEPADISAEDKALADRLQLPYNFFKTPEATCPGCCGCNPDDYVFPDYAADLGEELKNENPLPFTMPALHKPNDSLLKQSSFSLTPRKEVDQPATSIFGGAGSAASSTTSAFGKSSFSFGGAANSSIFGGGAPAPVFGTQPSIFGSSTVAPTTGLFSGSLSSAKAAGDSAPPSGLFSGALSAKPADATPPTGLFSGALSAKSDSNSTTTPTTGLFSGALSSASSTPPTGLFSGAFSAKTTEDANSASGLFSGGFSAKPAEDTKPSTGLFSGALSSSSAPPTGLFSGALSANPQGGLFGSASSFALPQASSTTIFGSSNTSGSSFGKSEEKAPQEAVFKSTGLDFASLAQTTPVAQNAFKVSENTAGGFVGLTNNDAFRNFMAPVKEGNANTSTKSQDGNANDDESYDPHYEPIIELPDEIVVSTGEENEKKLFGERATLFRYDSDTKQWKERGVGDFKILHHEAQGSFRLLLRREQIHKLVLNHAITAEFQMTNMNNNPKAFVWAAVNYAEEEPQTEKLAVRFKNVNLANNFKEKIEHCVEQLKKRAGLEPEED